MMDNDILEQVRRDKIAALVYGIGYVFIASVVARIITGAYLAIRYFLGAW